MAGKPLRTTLLAMATIGGLALAALPAGAAQLEASKPAERERHCVVAVVDETKGVLTTGPETCFRTFTEAEVFAGGASGSGQTAARSGGSNTIGIHYTSTSFGGSSVQVIGSTCSGGVWKPTGYWNNNIESSRHYCGPVEPTRFYDSSSCSGASIPITSSSTTLLSMNNKASCIRYGL